MTQGNKTLSESQLAELLARMRERAQHLLAQVEQRQAALEQPAAASRAAGDAADLAAVRAHADVESQLIDQQLQEVEAIGRAVARLDSGVYGCCAECGEDIGWERLKVRPTALRCAPCQEAHERASSGPSPRL
jgi:DnaK suppressor protein